MVVYRPFPTSNHNRMFHHLLFQRLYIVRFLHQTTTRVYQYSHCHQLYIVRFLHQTTTITMFIKVILRCISSVSYIKPQHSLKGPFTLEGCISSVSYIKPQQRRSRGVGGEGCISSVSYIKPQLYLDRIEIYFVVYRPFPTSNHNHRLPE